MYSGRTWENGDRRQGRQGEVIGPRFQAAHLLCHHKPKLSTTYDRPADNLQWRLCVSLEQTRVSCPEGLAQRVMGSQSFMGWWGSHLGVSPVASECPCDELAKNLSERGWRVRHEVWVTSRAQPPSY